MCVCVGGRGDDKQMEMEMEEAKAKVLSVDERMDSFWKYTLFFKSIFQ